MSFMPTTSQRHRGRCSLAVFFLNVPAPTEIYTLSLHDALPIYWQQALTVDKLHQLMMTRAFYLRTNNRQRHRMHNNLNWYLLEHLGYAPESTVYVPYLTAAWRMQRSQLG